jgi:hypothetical protein
MCRQGARSSAKEYHGGMLVRKRESDLIVVDRANDEESKDPFHADDRNLYKPEKWTRGGTKVDWLLYAGNDLENARELYLCIPDIAPQTYMPET